jgi:predicted SAM-dependent methyltransferase
MKLHIGGKQVKDGWKLFNIKPDIGVDFVGDIGNLSRFTTASIDEIYASHVLEHVPHRNALDTLRGIHRVLRAGGKFFVSVPDLDILARILIGPIDSLEAKFEVMKMIFGGQTDEFDFHYFGWNELFLTEFLAEANFSSARRVQSFGLFDDSSDYKPFGYPISLNMVAIK